MKQEKKAERIAEIVRDIERKPSVASYKLSRAERKKAERRIGMKKK